MTLLLVAAVLLEIPIVREIIVFVYLSFIPGFALLKALKLKDLNLLTTFLISAGLSFVVSMTVSLLVNELCLLLGLSQPLSVIPLVAAISTFTIIVFLISYRRGFSIDSVSINGMIETTKSHLSLTLVLVLLPILSTIAAFYVSIPVMIISVITIAVLCVLSVSSSRIIPNNYHAFLVFSVSISILFLHLFMSRYTIGIDSNLEYYVFKTALNRGFWGSIDAVTNSWSALVYNSMLSITLLPTIYSVMMNLQNEILFKILYSFIFSLVPLTLYGIYRSETGKLIALVSVFFFVFTANAFFGELISENRQIVGEFLLVLSIFLWLDKTLPLKEKRLLLVIFGISLAFSHYSLSLVYLAFISVVAITSTIKPRFDNAFRVSTILPLFGITFLWFAFCSGSVQTSILALIINTLRWIVPELTNFQLGTAAPGSVSVIYGLPEVFTAASWINLALSGLATLSLIIGVFAIIFFSKKLEISGKYRLLTIFGAILLAGSFSVPMIARTLNFTRFYAIALLFLSPCFALGALSVLKTLQDKIRKGNSEQEKIMTSLNKHGKATLLLVAILLGAYFLSQSGFVNYVTGGAIHSSTFDHYRIEESSDPQIAVAKYGTYIQKPDALSAHWLSEHASDTLVVYSDSNSRYTVLVSCGMTPFNLMQPLTNTTQPEKNSVVYLNGLSAGKGIIPAYPGLYNISEIPFSHKESNVLFSNGNGEIWAVVKSG